MAKITKYSTGIVGVIKHNLRDFKDGTCPTNIEVNPKLSKENYSILQRGKNAKEIELYRKQIDAECFQYNRKNIVHCIETIFTLPSDCPPEEEKRFFRESLNFLSSTLPMGEKCIFLAEVHVDEGRVQKEGKIAAIGAKHMHVMYVPGVADTKHEGYNFRLCADELTRRASLKSFHPKYQKWLDDAGIHATVSSGVTSGAGISVKALKEITKATGLSLEQIQSIEKENTMLSERLAQKEKEIIIVKEQCTKLKKECDQVHEELKKKERSLSFTEAQIEVLQEQYQSVNKAYSKRKDELMSAQKKISTLEVQNDSLKRIENEKQHAKETEKREEFTF